jgi:ABC-type multidrug transport system fused ATPase/permease subunit
MAESMERLIGHPVLAAMSAFQDLRAALRVLHECVDREIARRLAGAAAIAAAGGALAGLAPLALKEIVDALPADGRPGGNVKLIVVLALAYLGCLAAGRLLTEIRPPLMSGAEQHLYGRLRRRYFQHLLALPLAFHLDRMTGALVHVLQQAITGYQIILFHGVNSVLPLLVETVTVVAVLASVGQQSLTLVFVLTAVAYFAVTAWRSAHLSEAAKMTSHASMDVQALLTEGLVNCEPIKSFGAELDTLAAFEKSNADLQSYWASLQRQRMNLGLGITVIHALSMTCALAIATHAVTKGELTVGGFLLANLYMLQIIRPLELLNSATRDALQGLAFIKPFITVLHERAEDPPNAPAAVARSPLVRRAPAVNFHDIRLSFDGKQGVLDGLSLHVRAGRSTAIVGPSGAGKTSLVRLLLRLREPDSGSIRFDDVDIGTLSRKEVRSIVAVVPQDVVLFNASIAANIAFARSAATTAEIERAARLAGLHDFIATLPDGYGTVIGERGLKLSGGERQRVAIARAVLREPLVYVFDEATSMLDGPTEKAILKNLRDASAGRTTIAIAHRLSTIKDFDHIAVLAAGRIVEEGTHATLCARQGVYAALWNSQQASTHSVEVCD